MKVMHEAIPCIYQCNRCGSTVLELCEYLYRIPLETVNLFSIYLPDHYSLFHHILQVYRSPQHALRPLRNHLHRELDPVDILISGRLPSQGLSACLIPLEQCGL